MEKIVLIVYGVLMVFIFCYSLAQLHLTVLYIRYKRKIIHSVPESDALISTFELPCVTVQLPIYNELYVVERLLDAISKLDYPGEKLEIQVLDDSTDETVDIVAEKIKLLKMEGHDVIHIRRKERTGYKAGALANGLFSAKGEFVAIFDSDFIPSSDFLLKTIPLFADKNVGVVQSRWEHLNENYSMLTKLQAFGLDAHFSIEQQGRNAGGHFINFNGTAGVWRKTCIEDAGGWESDTLTEDLDLSYRAQLRKWKFIYLENLGSPAELPLTMSALKTQQFRWSKGAAECTKKNLGKVLRTKHLTLPTKVHAIFHLMNSFIFICIAITAILSVPVLVIKNTSTGYETFYKYSPVFFLSFVFLALFYLISDLSRQKKNSATVAGFFFRYPAFLSVSMGLSFHNAIAVWEGYSGKKSPFVRTPKFNAGAGSYSWKNNKYLGGSISGITYIEALLTIYFVSGVFLAFYFNDFALLPFHIMLFIGCAYVCVLSVNHSRKPVI